LYINLSDLLTQVVIITILEITLVIAILTITISRTKKQSSIAKAKNPLNSPQTNVPDSIEQTRQPEIKKEVLRPELIKHKRNPSETIAYTLLLSGTIALFASIVHSSYILAFIGLGLTFWGALFLFIKPTKYVKANLLDSTALSSLTTIDQIVTDLNYRGKAIYLPPKYLKAIKGGRMFISSKKDLIIPPVQEIANEKVFLKNSKGIYLTPPGLGLVNLYENELGKDFAKVDLDYLQNNLPKLFIEELEIAEDVEINVGEVMIRAKITGSIYKDFCKEARKLSNICDSFGCPLCSSIAIALTRTTGKPVIIEKAELSADGKTIETCYRIIKE